MTVPAGKAVARRTVAKKTATKAAPKKYATTRPGPNSRVPPKPKSDEPAPRKPSSSTKAIKSAAKNTVRKQARYYAPIQKPVKSVVTYRHVLAAEFILGLLLILTSKSDFKKGDKATQNVLMQSAAFLFVWMILFLITSGGRTSARFSAWLGGLIVLTLSVKQGNIFDRFAGIYGGKTPPQPGVLPDTPQNTENIIIGPIAGQPANATTAGQQPNPSTDLGGLIGLGPSGFGD